MNWAKREKIIIRELKKNKLSPSHGFDHLENVANFALKLSGVYGGKRDLLFAAALLHDLGRIEPKLHGKNSAQKSAKLAKPILKKAGYRQGEIKLITQIILEHDKVELSSNLLESRILKDADFLDGFGTRGLLRAVYYTAEAGETFEEVLSRIKVKMRKKYEGLEFAESRQIAQEGYSLVRLCLSYLNREKLEKELYKCKGKLIVFEGISGAGKETQAKLLVKYLRGKGRQVEIIFHPTPRLKNTLKEWRKEKIDSVSESFLFIGDRFDIVKRKLLPALRQGKFIISLRNRLSTLVYQGETDWEVKLIEFLYAAFEPQPDILFYFDLEPKIVLLRINKRSRKTGEEKGKFEKLELLKKKRKRYQNLLGNFKNVVIIDASKPIDKIQQDIVKSISDLL